MICSTSVRSVRMASKRSRVSGAHPGTLLSERQLLFPIDPANKRALLSGGASLRSPDPVSANVSVSNWSGAASAFGHKWTSLVCSAEGRTQIHPEIINVLDTRTEPEQGRRKMFLPRDSCPTLHCGFHGAKARRVVDELGLATN